MHTKCDKHVVAFRTMQRPPDLAQASARAMGLNLTKTVHVPLEVGDEVPLIAGNVFFGKVAFARSPFRIPQPKHALL